MLQGRRQGFMDLLTCNTRKMQPSGPALSTPLLSLPSLPPSLQITQLPQLQRLQLADCGFPAASLAQLSALSGSLTRLDSVRSLLTTPAGLGALTRLQHLRCVVEDGATMVAVEAALPALTGLTCLVGAGGRGWLSQVGQEARYMHLHAACCYGCCSARRMLHVLT